MSCMTRLLGQKVPKLDLKEEVGKVLKLHKHFSNLIFKRRRKQTQSNCNIFLIYLINESLQLCQPLLLLLFFLLYKK